MLLITEHNSDVSYLPEFKEDTKEKQHYIVGPFLIGEKANRNGRIYKMPVLDNAVNSYIKEHVNTKRALGELGHPPGPQINLDRASHLITELKKEGNVYMGKALIMNTPMGNIAKGMLESGVSLGVSSRGMGSLKPMQEGIMEVQDDFRLSTIDLVSDPSGPGAYVNGIMENVNWIYDPVKNTWLEEKLDNIKKEIHTLSKRELEEQQLAIFENYISSLLLNTKN